MGDLVEPNTEFSSLADKFQAVVPASQTAGDNSFIYGLRNGTSAEFFRKYHVSEVNTAVDLVNPTLTNYPANLNTGVARSVVYSAVLFN